jgi:hypothetical protein
VSKFGTLDVPDDLISASYPISSNQIFSKVEGIGPHDGLEGSHGMNSKTYLDPKLNLVGPFKPFLGWIDQRVRRLRCTCLTKILMEAQM